MVDKERLETFLAERPNVIIAGTRSDGRRHVTPNWFLWDGERFYVSTTRSRAKYSIFQRDPRAQLLFDDAVDFRAVLVDAGRDPGERRRRALALSPDPREVPSQGSARRRAREGPYCGGPRPSRPDSEQASRHLDVVGPGLNEGRTTGESHRRDASRRPAGRAPDRANLGWQPEPLPASAKRSFLALLRDVYEDS